MNENDEIREVYSAADLFEAEHMRYLLSEVGIVARITGAPLQTIIGELPAQLSAPGLLVRSEDFTKARALIDQEVAVLREQRLKRTDWNCATCGEENSPEFAVCWSCQSSYETKTQ